MERSDEARAHAMSPLSPLLLKTKHLIDLLEQVPEEDKYDVWMERVQSLLNEREQLLQAHSADLTIADQDVIRKLVADSRSIDLKLSVEHARLGVQMGQMRQTKSTRKSYVDPYDEVEGSFSPYFDSRQ
ncbi:hypothetical protein [Exiguobacterium flavidum]|uniref:hypothetical protein n=1 Tax=Exiguobacterium flavidum TaxID=2184695 RepID=UPI001E2CE490|nr:hypothetical protein [Exiguobacterium flavidum]